MKFPSTRELHPKDLAQVLVIEGREKAGEMLHEWASNHKPVLKVFEVSHVAQAAMDIARKVQQSAQ